MEIRIQQQNDPLLGIKGEPTLVIKHGDQTLQWNIPAKELDSNFDVFSQINGYWAKCEQATQLDIFNIYAEIHKVFQTVWDINARVAALRPLIRDLMEYHPQEDIYVWAWTKGGCVVPSNIHRTFDSNGTMAGTLERTYLENDYRDLVVLSISLRVMFPIWRQFTNDSRRESGNVFKEYQAFKLLSLASSVIDSAAMRRLAVFVQHTIPKERHGGPALLQGISSEDLPNWVMSVTVVSRLCCGDVRGYNEQNGESTTTLPAYLYNFIQQKLRSLETSIGNVSPKFSSSYSPDSDSNLSKLEGFKIKQQTSTGNIEAISAYLDIQMRHVLENPNPGERSLVRRMNPNPDFIHLVREAYESIQQLSHARLTREQVTIAAWVMSPYVSQRAIPSLKKHDLLKMIAFSQAYLWVNNHHHLAVLVSAQGVEGMDRSVGFIADRKDPMEKEEQAELIKRFPFQRRTSSRAKNAKTQSLVNITIENLTQSLSKYDWRITLPDAWLEKANMNTRNKLFKVPTDIRTRLARLVIDIDSIVPFPPIAEHHVQEVNYMPETNLAEV